MADEQKPEAGQPEQTPPAAKIVAEGEVSEETINLREQLKAEKLRADKAEAGQREAQDKCSRAEKKVQDLLEVQTANPSTPPKKARTGWGFFNES